MDFYRQAVQGFANPTGCLRGSKCLRRFHRFRSMAGFQSHGPHRGNHRHWATLGCLRTDCGIVGVRPARYLSSTKELDSGLPGRSGQELGGLSPWHLAATIRRQRHTGLEFRFQPRGIDITGNREKANLLSTLAAPVMATGSAGGDAAEEHLGIFWWARTELPFTGMTPAF